MEIKLAGRAMPRGPNGDVKFTMMHGKAVTDEGSAVLHVFTEDEVVELVNRAIYQLEYQAAAHKKRGATERARMKALKTALGKAGAKTAETDRQLKGE